MKIGILGRTRMLYNTMERMISAGHEVVFIGTCKASPEYSINEDDFESFAARYRIPFFCDTNLDKYKQLMIDSSAEVVLSMNWLNIIQESIISLFPHGILNAHPGKLPAYRGNACPNWAIINGETMFSITIHYMSPGELDSGDIVMQKDYPILSDTTITEIYKILYQEIPVMFEDAVNKISTLIFNPTRQNELLISRCYPRLPRDSFIDWNLSCSLICRIVRASTIPFEGAYTYYNDLKCYIHSCNIEYEGCRRYVYPGQIVARDRTTGIVKVAAKDGNICFGEVLVNGNKHKAAEIFTSTRIRLNYDIQEEIYELRTRIIELEKVCKGK